MGEFTTNSRPLTRSFLITKYLLLFLIVINILSSIWVGIYNRQEVDRMKIKYPDDRWTHDQGRGHSAQLWERLCITFLVFENIFNLIGLIGTLQENYCLALLYGVLMFLCALYGSGAKFVRGSVCSYLMPLIVGIIASLFAHQIRMENYDPKQTQPKSAFTVVATEELIYTAPKPKPPPKTISNPLISASRKSSAQNGESIQLNGFNGSTTYV